MLKEIYIYIYAFHEEAINHKFSHAWKNVLALVIMSNSERTAHQQTNACLSCQIFHLIFIA